MVSTTPLEQISQLPNPDELIELLTIDASTLFSPAGVPGGIFYLCPYPMDGISPGPIVWNTLTFIPIPMSLSGFLSDSQGSAPQPKLSLSNIGSIWGSILLDYNDLKGSIVTRIRTYKRYLDGGIEADPTLFMVPDVYIIDQKTSENNTLVEWNLASALDQQGIKLPGGLVLKDTCTHSYRIYQAGAFSYVKVTCPYVGTAYFTTAGISTLDPSLDDCGRKTSDCILRFPGAPLPTRAFPGVSNNAG